MGKLNIMISVYLGPNMPMNLQYWSTLVDMTLEREGETIRFGGFMICNMVGRKSILFSLKMWWKMR